MNTTTTRTFDTGFANYGVVVLTDLEQFNIFEDHYLSAPEIAASTMAFRVKHENGNLANNADAVWQILRETAEFIGRDMTSEEFTTASVMMGKVK